ncbi:hypothetical protein CJ030_MR1G006669 [Morella rubra]|uniref:XS domain-containing protein n=1 Tax=Morella rubra TaxID=262757 RepID=A0A6A1WMQ1_9ROSI|nr:hypothetical protein CJ030_MR1G006669 [Morella rubra]
MESWGHSGFAIVEFKNDWAGFENAMSCAKSFEVDHFGKRDFYAAKNRGDKLFGWMAHKDDYDSRCPIGLYLRKKTDVKTISAIEAEDQRKALTLVSNLTNNLEMKTSHLEEMWNKYQEAGTSLSKLMGQKEEMLKAYNEETRKMQQDTRNHFENILKEHQEVSMHLEAQKKRLEQVEEQLRQREAQNETERRKLHDEKNMREKENLHRKIIELEKKLDAKQALELEVEA